MCVTVLANAQLIGVSDESSPDSFPLVADNVAWILFDAGDAKVVDIAAHCLADDIERVTSRKPEVLNQLPEKGNAVVVVGTIGQSRFIDALVDAGKLDVSAIEGQWESFIITTLENSTSGIDNMLVIAGNDRRGTAYGIFTLSESIGVSPWYWWDDVPTLKQNQLFIPPQSIKHGPPSVKYRGIFINDEDWGLQPWAARHMDTDIKDIGPKTYARVFELLLRLKANYCWPAMHRCTQAFNNYPDDKIVADNYAIVMGSSHCEPMLRNNVTEWDKKTMGEWSYDTNPQSIYKYWEERVEENGRFENVYTVGMRGIHDSGIPGGRTKEDKRDILQRVIDDQRTIIAEYVNPDPSQVPQIFCPYKEVLGIYKLGLDLPDDVTIVWPDDNHGYIRNLSTPEERKRSGHSGIYYHLSYWGAPQDYLWLSTTSPAKIAYEMGKAYAYGADRVWVFNVGDIKPCEKELDFAMRLAYDIDSWPPEKAMDFIAQWASRTFGDQCASGISDIFKEYYRLTQQARPEHNDQVTFTGTEKHQRLDAYNAISDAVDAISSSMDARYRDALFELVAYPVKCADLMNQKWTYAGWRDADKAVAAYDEIQQLTEEYNKKVADGKWNGIMDAAPRRRAVYSKPNVGRIQNSKANSAPLISLDLSDVRCSGKMQLHDNNLVAGDPDIQTEGTDSSATFVFESKIPKMGDLYFLAQCPDDKHDSWFVSFNGSKTVSNNHVTGAELNWIKIMEVELNEGRNELVISQREPGTVIKQVVLMDQGVRPRQNAPEPTFVFAANEYSAEKNGSGGEWKKIEGLGIEPFAMAVFPYERPTIQESHYKGAPALAYVFNSSADKCMIECRFLPTHRINVGMGLRYAISVDGGAPVFRNINAPENSPIWSRNVLNGYAAGKTDHALNHSSNHTAAIYLLDPGMVLSQVRIYAED